MHETAIEEFAGTERVYLPSTSVMAPVLVLPTTKTAAPITGTPCASVTVPLIGLFCAESPTQKREANIIDIATALANKFLSIEKLIC
jgi:hypothetical protein